MTKLITGLTPKTTAQDLFNYITVFLMKQGQASKSTTSKNADIDVCAYRGDQKRMCAVGCVLPDKFFRSAMEGQSVALLINEGLDRKEEKTFWKALDRHLELLLDLQLVHDEAFSLKSREARKSWRADFKQIAEDFELKFETELYKEWA